MEKTLNFEVDESSVLFNSNGKIVTSEKYKTIYRTDNNLDLNVVSKSYQLLKNEQFMEYVNKMIKITNFNFEGYSTIKNGGVVLAHLKNNLEDFRIGKSKIDDYMIIGNSHDNTFPFFIGSTTVVVWCQNQFSQIKKTERIRHTQSFEERVENLYNDIEFYIKYRNLMYENFQIFNDTKIKNDTVDIAVKKLLNIDKEMIEKGLSSVKRGQVESLTFDISSEIERLGKSVWGFFNGVTKYTTHTLNSKEKGFGIVNGRAYEINQKAYNLSLELV